MSDILEAGQVQVEVREQVGLIEFSHPKANSLPGALLAELKDKILELGKNPEVRVILLSSEGDKAFCAGASFDEFKALDTYEKSREFFMGFARLILAMTAVDKFIVTRVQGKVVGGGVGIAAASDFVFATREGSVRLSEFAIGIGPFVVGPAVERKVGHSAFAAMSIDADWRNAEWALENNLFQRMCAGTEELNRQSWEFALQLAARSVEATRELKTVLRKGTEEWQTLLPARAEISGKLLVTSRKS